MMSVPQKVTVTCFCLGIDRQGLVDWIWDKFRVAGSWLCS